MNEAAEHLTCHVMAFIVVIKRPHTFGDEMPQQHIVD